MEPSTQSNLAAQSRKRTRHRLSVFKEVGLRDDDSSIRRVRTSPTDARSSPCVRFHGQPDVIRRSSGLKESEWDGVEDSDVEQRIGKLDRRTTSNDLPVTRRRSAFVERLDISSSSVSTKSTNCRPLRQLGFLACLLALVVPFLNRLNLSGVGTGSLLGVNAGAVPHDTRHVREVQLERREKTDTDVCKRWSQQTALINGTLYLYGGRATENAHQDTNQWNSDFLSLDLTSSWEISGPPFEGMDRPDGPPPVSNGYLWASRTSFYLYGGEFSEAPDTSPVPFVTWEYSVPDDTWTEHPDPVTSAGVDAPAGGVPVGRAAEGAGFSVAALGRGWYFGGHQDGYTTGGPNWDPLFIPRVYLKSMLEFTFPSFSNDQVFALKDGDVADEDGVYRNITDGGVDSSSFPERADGVLVYIPGFSDEGILLGIAGGTNNTFTQTNLIDVYDIATSTWYQQSTVGEYPKPRVNPCAVVAAAPDGSSYNVYMFAGQALIPYGSQQQYDDLWILSVPSFTWIRVDQPGQSVPYARSGHTCNIWDGQMIVVGGYVPEISCETGVYVLNASSLEWATSYNALSAGDEGNPFAQQSAQIGDNKTAGLDGSFGYTVPDIVVSAIGGGPLGGATITKPAQSATGGPLATGSPITYTVTRPDGSIVTSTTLPGGSSSSADDGPNIAAIVAGTIAGVLAIMAAYFGFCAWVYRRQLMLYKNHVAATQRAALDQPNHTTTEKDGLAAPGFVGATSAAHSRSSRDHRGPASLAGSGGGASGSAGIAAANNVGAQPGGAIRRSSTDVDDDDLLGGQEPSFWGTRGVLLNPRRSLRVINRD